MLIENFIDLLLDAAPWLIGGLVIAGLIHSFAKTETLAKYLGEEHFTAILKAALFGAPLPLCSCSVIPAAISLRRNGASKSATVSFLVSTPETGVDSIAVSYGLLGPFMAIMRPLAAIASAVTAGGLTAIFCAAPPKAQGVPTAGFSPTAENRSEGNRSEESSRCPSKSCCTSGQSKTQTLPDSALLKRFLEGQRYAFVDIFNDMAGWLIIGLMLAAATLTWIPEQFLTQWGGGFSAMLVMALVGIPMYICATASTPIAAGLLLAGVSPGAALVFMLAGPATNIATLGIIKRELGSRALSCYLGGVLSIAFVSGYATNALVETLGIDIQTQLAASSSLLPSWLMWGSALLLSLLLLNYARSKLRHRAAI